MATIVTSQVISVIMKTIYIFLAKKYQRLCRRQCAAHRCKVMLKRQRKADKNGYAHAWVTNVPLQVCQVALFERETRCFGSESATFILPAFHLYVGSVNSLTGFESVLSAKCKLLRGVSCHVTDEACDFRTKRNQKITKRKS